MELQWNPNSWSCLPTAFAMVIGMPVSEFIELVGHDGSTEPWDGYKIGFHEQECIDIADSLGWYCTPIQRYPTIIPCAVPPMEPVTIHFSIGNELRFANHLNTNGVFLGGILNTGIGHAVAWDSENQLIYDPRGMVFALKQCRERNYYFQSFWKIRRAN
jgi:hypothetical protein